MVELETLTKKYASRAAAAAKEESETNSINFFARARQYGLDECEIIEGDVDGQEDDNIDDDYVAKRNSKKALVVGSSGSDDFSGASKDILQLAIKGGNNSKPTSLQHKMMHLLMLTCKTLRTNFPIGTCSITTGITIFSIKECHWHCRTG